MKYLYLVLISFIFIGCTKSPHKPLHVRSLEQTIFNIKTTINQTDAKTLANEMIYYSAKLKEQYKLVTPPLFHNFLVNMGVKKRGLCWHFAYDMLAHAKKQNLTSFDYYIGGANINDYWEEHNSLIVTCKGCKFEQGVVLDPWRNSGNLYYSYVKDDKKYIWTQRGKLR